MWRYILKKRRKIYSTHKVHCLLLLGPDVTMSSVVKDDTVDNFVYLIITDTKLRTVWLMVCVQHQALMTGLPTIFTQLFCSWKTFSFSDNNIRMTSHEIASFCGLSLKGGANSRVERILGYPDQNGSKLLIHQHQFQSTAGKFQVDLCGQLGLSAEPSPMTRLLPVCRDSPPPVLKCQMPCQAHQEDTYRVLWQVASQMHSWLVIVMASFGFLKELLQLCCPDAGWC